jgi:hypothetical protein
MLQCACNRAPQRYRPPEQQAPRGEVKTVPPVTMIEMSAPTAPAHFVSDIDGALSADNWRWTGKRPTVRQLVAERNGNKLVADLAVPEGAFQQTGPVTISFFIGDHLLDQVRYEKPGQKHFEKPVPPEWLSVHNDTLIAAEIDKVYVAEKDQTRLGFILVRIGFERE